MPPRGSGVSIRRFARHRLQLCLNPDNKEISLQTYIESEGNHIMLEYIIVAGLAIVVVLAIILISVKRSETTGRPAAPPNVYDKSYAPGMIGSTAGPLPLGRRTERKKTETFRQHSDD